MGEIHRSLGYSFIFVGGGAVGVNWSTALQAKQALEVLKGYSAQGHGSYACRLSYDDHNFQLYRVVDVYGQPKNAADYLTLITTDGYEYP
ncbi:hypothetical protein [Streptomyces sp. BA2]|uniref:hypothetical protein n=1 Tax=Streptomyces sp. BA2 TaxID=436595 RepID=UPI001324CFF9|nr:hypothetical protein [Streptomyces sp. BA2]MWA07733.1 hypothetical protein [Streptomyces sp. BA2]